MTDIRLARDEEMPAAPATAEPQEADEWHIELDKNDFGPEAGAGAPAEGGFEIVEARLVEDAPAFVDDELHALAHAAADRVGSAERDPSAWQRAARKAQARITATGIALMTLIPLAGVAPKAEAGEGGRKAARIGAEILWEGNQALYEEQMRKMEEARAADMAAEQAGWSIQQMEMQGEELLRRYEELAQAQAQNQTEIDALAAKESPSRGDTRRLQYLSRQQAGYASEMTTIKARLARLDAGIQRAGARAEAAGQAAEKAEKDAKKMRRIGAGARVLGSILDAVGRR